MSRKLGWGCSGLWCREVVSAIWRDFRGSRGGAVEVEVGSGVGPARWGLELPAYDAALALKEVALARSWSGLWYLSTRRTGRCSLSAIGARVAAYK